MCLRSDALPMSRIFISYRRDDSAGYTGRVYDRLAEEYGSESIFMDVDTIPPGVDFKRYIESHVAACNVMLVMIGKQWTSITDAQGQRRLDNPGDFVRLEIASALRREIPVVPVLVRGATMPGSDELPDDLQGLLWRNGVTVDDRKFHHDMDDLIKGIDFLLSRTEAELYTPAATQPRHLRQADTPQPEAKPASPPPEPAPPAEEPATTPAQPAEKQPQSDPVRQQLASMFGFTLDDLEMNRKGELSARQKANDASYETWFQIYWPFGWIPAYVIAGGGILLALMNPDSGGNIAGGVLCIGSLAGIWVLAASIGLKLYPPKLKSMNGKVTVHKQLRYITVKRNLFRAEIIRLKEALETRTLPYNGKYNVHYLDSGGNTRLLSLEPAED